VVDFKESKILLTGLNSNLLGGERKKEDMQKPSGYLGYPRDINVRRKNKG